MPGRSTRSHRPHSRDSLATRVRIAAAAALTGAISCDLGAAAGSGERVHPQESRVGIGALLSRETARMRESLASAALGRDHSLLLARKRSTDWTFLAAAVTAGIGAGTTEPEQLLASIVDCDPGTRGSGHFPPDADRAPAPWPAHGIPGTPLVADVLTCVADEAGTDFPCAIRWRVVVDANGLSARALWHEPMVALRGFDAPLVPDRTTIRLDAHGTDVECWGFGRHADPWPESPAPLDQLGDSYDLADAARHWWWARHRLPTRTAACAGPCVVDLPECDVVRMSPWVVSSAERVRGDSPAAAMDDATEVAVRGSIAVPLRPDPSQLLVHSTRLRCGRARTMNVRWVEEGRCRGALAWSRIADSAGSVGAAHRAGSTLGTRSAPGASRTGGENPEHGAPSHGWLDAQARLQLLQHVPLPAVLPEPYSRNLILGDAADESAAHARATANIWHAAVTGNCAALADALAVGESLRRRRGLPRSIDAMALAALAESLLDRDAPERSIALVVARHMIAASALPADRAAANAECAGHDLMPPLCRPDYAAMLARQGRTWGWMHCMLPGWMASASEVVQDAAAHPAAEPLVAQFDRWQSSRQSPAAAGSGAPAAIHARTLAISAAESRSPSGGMAKSSSSGSVSTVRSELASGSPGFTMILPFLSLPTRVAGSSSRMPAFDLPRPWQSKQRASNNGSRSEYATTTLASVAGAAGSVAVAGTGAAGSVAVAGAGATVPCCDTRSAVHRARVT
jgi:hypothetical protein